MAAGRATGKVTGASDCLINAAWLTASRPKPTSTGQEVKTIVRQAGGPLSVGTGFGGGAAGHGRHGRLRHVFIVLFAIRDIRIVQPVHGPRRRQGRQEEQPVIGAPHEPQHDGEKDIAQGLVAPALRSG